MPKGPVHGNDHLSLIHRFGIVHLHVWMLAGHYFSDVSTRVLLQARSMLGDFAFEYWPRPAMRRGIGQWEPLKRTPMHQSTL